MSSNHLDNFGRVDQHGQVHYTVDDLCDLLLCGVNTDALLVDQHPEVDYLNNWLLGDNQHQQVLIYQENTTDPVTYHTNLQKEWTTPKPWVDMDIETWLYEQCTSVEQVLRVEVELQSFKKSNMIPLLRHLKYLVDHFEENNILWGIGRGSSCASYCLYLIGIHCVDSIKFNLNFEEFLS